MSIGTITKSLLKIERKRETEENNCAFLANFRGQILCVSN
jgi:hypothetical protein